MKTETVDVLVIGSGPGGAIVALEAAKRGRNTMVLEAGPWVRGKDQSHDEIDMLGGLYKDGGLQLNTSMDMFIMQGVCVGGSSVLANMALFRPEEDVFDDWQRNGAVFDRPALTRSFDHVEKVLGAGPPPMENVAPSSRFIMKGAKDAGLEAHWMLKSLGECTGCGGCNLGCVFDHKRSTLQTWIPWAEEAGARVMPETRVTKIEWKRGRATSVLAVTGKEKTPLRVVAKQIVVSCGAIGSSALLLKSGIKKNVGTRLSFNVGAGCMIEFPEPIDDFDGDQMTAYAKGDGFHIEPVNLTPVMAALMTPGWFKDHSRLMGNYRHHAFSGALVGSQPVGRVVQSPFFGHEETRFHMPEGDMAKLRRGLKALVKMFFAAGARRIFLPTHQLTTLDRPEDAHLIDTMMTSTRQFQIGSSHPQGGNPLSDDPDLGVVDRDFAVHGFENLFISDASVFTSCVRVNPINTIMAVANYAAPRILARN